MRKVISGILLVILLAVTVGLPIYRHTCHVFDRSELSFMAEEPCCNPDGDRQEASLDFECCSLEHFSTTLDYETLVEKTEFKVFQLIALVPEILSTQVNIIEVHKALPITRPPPLANRQLLNKYQVYRL